MPQRYDIRISFEQLERTAQEWLGWPFDKAALPQVDYLEQDKWIMKGDVWGIQQVQNGTLDVSMCETFRLGSQKDG